MDKIAAATPREPPAPGIYGRVAIRTDGCARIGAVHVIVPDAQLGMTAAELREAAHLFNQLAEVLEAEEKAYDALPNRPGGRIDPFERATHRFMRGKP